MQFRGPPLSTCIWSKILFLSASAMMSVTAWSQPGSVDPTFDPGRGPLGVSASRGNAVLIQPDGKILVTGEFNGVDLDFVPAVVRFNPDGSLDGSFSASALPASSSFAPDDLARLLALQPNGQILVAGTFTNSDGSARCLTRLNGDGSLDVSFRPRIEHSNGVGVVQQATILGDGRILIGGFFEKINGVSRPSFARLNADGSLDETFKPAVASSSFVVQSTGKIVLVSFGNQLVRLNPDGSIDHTFTSASPSPNGGASSLLVQPDDKLIWTRVEPGFIPEYTTTILRLNADGTTDPGFQPFTSLGGMALLVQNDGKIVIVVVFSEGPSRLNSDGTPDSSFKPQALEYFVAQQPDGKLVTVGGFYDWPYGIRRLFLDGARDDSFAPEIGLTRISQSSVDRARLLPNGKIVIAGNFNYVDRTPRTRLAVLNTHGTLDVTFDAGALFDGKWDGNSNVNALAVQSDGKILAAFHTNLVRLNHDGREDGTFHYSPAPNGFVTALGVQSDGRILLTRSGQMMRLKPDGSVDSTFPNGRPGNLVSLQPDGKILLTEGNRLIRLNPDGALDTAFNADGVRGFIAPTFLALQPDGKILVSRFENSLRPFVLTRLNPDGSVDETFNPQADRVQLAAADQKGIYVIANLASSGESAERGLLRLLPDGSRDPDFAVTFNPGATVTTLLLQADGQLIVAGDFNEVNDVERHSIARVFGDSPEKLANISTRARVGRAESVEIGGFIITGNASKKVIVRAIGPSLESNGMAGILLNPSLELRDASGAVIGHSDDWREGEATEIIASGIPPAHNAESAIVRTLAPGRYTAVVQGSDGGEGIALVEIYDLDAASDSKLANISTRGSVHEDDGVMIAGFILQGSESSTMALRALGPSLGSAGVTAPLGDPALTVHNQSGSVVAANDDWKQTQGNEIAALGLGSTDDRDSALIAMLPPGSYTAVVRGKTGQSGIALVEAYQLE